MPASAPENRSTAEYGLRYRTGRLKPKSASQEAEFTGEFEPENLSQKTNLLYCERVNEVTFKLTDGEVTNVPASHGQWGGYRTTKALAWIISSDPMLGSPAVRDQVCNPSSFNEAKSQALAMARGADGDYFVENPIRDSMDCRPPPRQ